MSTDTDNAVDQARSLTQEALATLLKISRDDALPEDVRDRARAALIKFLALIAGVQPIDNTN
jgi:hypothetical protein